MWICKIIACLTRTDKDVCLNVGNNFNQKWINCFVLSQYYSPLKVPTTIKIVLTIILAIKIHSYQTFIYHTGGIYARTNIRVHQRFQFQIYHTNIGTCTNNNFTLRIRLNCNFSQPTRTCILSAHNTHNYISISFAKNSHAS